MREYTRGLRVSRDSFWSKFHLLRLWLDKKPVLETFCALRTWILRCLEPRTWKQSVEVLSLCWGGPGSCWHLLEVHSQCKAGETGGLQAVTPRDVFTKSCYSWREQFCGDSLFLGGKLIQAFESVLHPYRVQSKKVPLDLASQLCFPGCIFSFSTACCSMTPAVLCISA